MKHELLFISLFGLLLGATPWAMAAEAVPAASEAEPVPVLHFQIDRFVVENASLLTQAELDAAVAPYLGKNKDFSDVQRIQRALLQSGNILRAPRAASVA